MSAEAKDELAGEERRLSVNPLAPETTIGIAALFVAVAGLARTIGGFAAAVTAALVGAALATLLVVPLLRALEERRAGRAGAAGWLTVGLAASLVTTGAAFSGLFAYDAVHLANAASTRDAIRTAILKSYAAELSWYKNPSSDRRALLEQWFVPVAAGGERLRIIEAEIARLRRCQRKVGAEAATTTFVSSITVSGSSA